jgi:hypothetical protein
MASRRRSVSDQERGGPFAHHARVTAEHAATTYRATRRRRPTAAKNALDCTSRHTPPKYVLSDGRDAQRGSATTGTPRIDVVGERVRQRKAQFE